MADFTHFNDQGRAKMVDVCVGGGGKSPFLSEWPLRQAGCW